MAHGRMLIASDVGGHREMIEHGKTGMLFTAGDADALIGEVLYLVKHVELWPVLRQQARTYITRERSWTASVARYAAIYQRLLSST
jgi:glycosyltransferase involved in cell wall biosynthesis